MGECFGETWLRAADKAGIFFWGASASTFWDEDDWLERNWFKAWWDDGIEAIGGLTLQGMLYTVSDIGGPGSYPSQYYFEAYNVMGDPSCEIEAIEFTWDNDVGAVAVNYPVDESMEGQIVVNATIQNFGYNPQTDFPVSCDIHPLDPLPNPEDFEVDDGGYTESGTSLWEWGAPLSGPGDAHSGDNCWSTNREGNYPNNADAYLDSPALVLALEPPLELSFWHWFEIESGWDYGYVRISTDGGSTWDMLDSYTGYEEFWHEETIDLSLYAGEEVIIRWHFYSDYSLYYAGWYLDDVSIIGALIPGEDIVYEESEFCSIDENESIYVDFVPAWIATPGMYRITVATELAGDEKPANDAVKTLVTISTYNYIPPSEYEIIRGLYISGDLDDLYESDDERLVIRAGITLTIAEPPVWIVLTATSPTELPTQASFLLEARVNVPGMILQTIELYNYDIEDYEEVDARIASMTDQVVEIILEGDLSRFVDQNTLEMNAQLTWLQVGPVPFSAWQVGIDQSVWMIT